MGTDQDLFDNPASKLRYEAFSRLQAAAVAFGESCSLPIPEIVAIGGQSDGKSSLLEAFLGFRFNVREVEMGTRRPLIVQMVHDPAALQPRCRLQEEDSDEFGPVLPEAAIADAIVKRTQDHLHQLGGASVSGKPIVMRAEYAYCANLTIIDTPGFILKARNGEADSTPDDIMRMVRQQAAPSHRLILFLQQSSVEWASSLWLHVVQEVDPTFSRTVMVASKFDNRLKEFAERWEVDRYLAATGYLAPNVKPFFVALPKDRQLQGSAEWRSQMADVDRTVFGHLREGVKGGFDEDRFGSRIGFGNLKRFLEEELARRYREAAPATLALLQERCQGVAKELLALEARIQACSDVAALRRASMAYAASMSSHVQVILEGSSDPDPSQHGMTSEDERARCNMQQWPGVMESVRPPNAGLRLFGGAAFERCLNEFQEAANALRFPSASVARDRIANVLLARKGRDNLGGAARAAEDIARQAAREMLAPLLDAACARLAFVLRRSVDAAADRAGRSGAGRELLQPYTAFHAALRAAHASFVSRLEAKARDLLRHHLDAATSEFALGLMAGAPDLMWPPAGGGGGARLASEDGGGGGLENVPPEEQGDDVLAIGTVPETPSPGELSAQQAAAAAAAHAARRGGGGGSGAGRQFVDNTPSKGRVAKAQRVEGAASGGGGAGGVCAGLPSTYSEVVAYAERLFGRIRGSVAGQAAPTTLKAAFLEPMCDELATDVALDLFAKTDSEFMAMFTAAGALSTLQTKRDAVHRRAEGLLKCKTEFQELAKCL
ncbi:MAG: P-loop containing nucleoside triphosphate hydrolase protein [Monoraphidium minutum]|nr:MAG: P-loop containing nucleoside triphosphate hydrolase protein [Monoraphidium minutum]